MGGPGLFGAQNSSPYPNYLLEQGITIVSLQYRLVCTGAGVQEMLEDLRDGINYVVDNAEQLGIDPTNMAMMGQSAGAHLSLAFAYNARMRPQAQLIKGLVNVFGPTELRPQELAVASPSLYDRVASFFFSVVSKHYGVCQTSSDLANCYDEISPIAHVSLQAPPTLTLHGHDDPLVLFFQAKKLHKALDQYNISNTLVDMPHTSHAFNAISESPLSQAGLFALDRFLVQIYEI